MSEITSVVPRDARVLYLPSTKKGAHGDYKQIAVPVQDFTPLQNYGVVLDGLFLLVDFDKDDPRRAELSDKLPPTWTQTTPHGEHRLYRVPKGWSGNNARLTNEAGLPIGDVKVHGYFVGPGSVYEKCPNHPLGCERKQSSYVCIDDRNPVDAPDWVLALCEAAKAEEAAQRATERDIIPDGQRDNELTSIAGFFRRQGFGEAGITLALRGIIHSGLVEQPPGREVEEKDIKRIARSIAKKPTSEQLDGLAVSALIGGGEVPLIGPPVRWWERGYVPRSELVMIYGDGGTGKSTFGSWLAAEVTRKGGTFVFCGVEEPFRRFLMRAVLMGGVRERIYSYTHASKIALPISVPRMREDIDLLTGGKSEDAMLYFDSIYSHFQTEAGLNAAERARRCLAPLAEWAQETGMTCVGVFHTNKAGEFLGSVEMRNVARYVLKATRKANQPLRIDVDKTNIWDPGAAMAFAAEETTAHDPATGEVQLEEKEDGRFGDMTMKVLARQPDIPISPETVVEPIELALDDIAILPEEMAT